MTLLQLMAAVPGDGSSVALDAVENAGNAEPEDLGTLSSEPFLAGSDDLLALAVALNAQGFWATGVSLADSTLAPIDPHLGEQLEAELVRLIREANLFKVLEYSDGELDGLYVLSVELRDKTQGTGRVRLMQDGAVVTDSEVAVRRFTDALHGSRFVLGR